MRTPRTLPLRRAWIAALAAFLVLTAAACGGDDDDASGSQDDTVTETDAVGDSDDTDTDTDTDTGTDDDQASGAVGASVTIDGVTYEATEQQVCTAVGGAIAASFSNDDFSRTITLTLLPPDDPERSTVRVDDESDPDDIIQWESGGETIDSNPGFRAVAQVKEATIDGRTASGTATFIDTTKMMTGTATPIDGTFAVQCAEL